MIEVINTIQIPLSKLVPNNGQIDGIPKNPRFIKSERYDRLVKSILDHPEFLGARELIVYKQGEKYIVLCGNMRYRASKELNIEQLPCKVIPEYFSLEQIKAIIIKDNISFGDDDMEALANEWDVADLVDWGYEFTNFVNETEQEPDFEDLIGEEKNKPATMKITFESPEQLQKAEIDIQELLDRKYKGAYFSVSAGDI